MRVANVAGELDCVVEIHPHFFRRVRIRTKSQRDADLRSHLEDLFAGIHFFAIFAQSGGVDFDGDSILFSGLEEPFEEWRAILLRVKTKLFAQISMTNYFKQP